MFPQEQEELFPSWVIFTDFKSYNLPDGRLGTAWEIQTSLQEFGPLLFALDLRDYTVLGLHRNSNLCSDAEITINIVRAGVLLMSTLSLPRFDKGDSRGG